MLSPKTSSRIGAVSVMPKRSRSWMSTSPRLAPATAIWMATTRALAGRRRARRLALGRLAAGEGGGRGLGLGLGCGRGPRRCGADGGTEIGLLPRRRARAGRLGGRRGGRGRGRRRGSVRGCRAAGRAAATGAAGSKSSALTRRSPSSSSVARRSSEREVLELRAGLLGAGDEPVGQAAQAVDALLGLGLDARPRLGDVAADLGLGLAALGLQVELRGRGLALGGAHDRLDAGRECGGDGFEAIGRGLGQGDRAGGLRAGWHEWVTPRRPGAAGILAPGRIPCKSGQGSGGPTGSWGESPPDGGVARSASPSANPAGQGASRMEAICHNSEPEVDRSCPPGLDSPPACDAFSCCSRAWPCRWLCGRSFPCSPRAPRRAAPPT